MAFENLIILFQHNFMAFGNAIYNSKFNANII